MTLSTSKSIGKKLEKGGSGFSGDPIPVGKSGGMIRFEFFDDGCSKTMTTNIMILRSTYLSLRLTEKSGC